jgi:hypothetical protein
MFLLDCINIPKWNGKAFTAMPMNSKWGAGAGVSLSHFSILSGRQMESGFSMLAAVREA